MQFDNDLKAECAPGNPGGTDIDPATCQDTPPGGPSDDPRCADPSFRAANPELCDGYPLLILKPEYSIIAAGDTVQYRTFLRTDGDEVEILQGLTYLSSDVGVAVIGSDGLASGLVAGVSTISVAWQDLSASAQIEVVVACAEVVNNIIILIDNSFSSKVTFSSAYSSKLAYAKEAAVKFSELVNYGKDKVGVAYFNEGGVTALDLSANKASVISAIQSITATSAKTNIHAGMKVAMDKLALVSGGKIVLMFTDGENNQGSDPEVLSTPWKEAGNLLLVVALRAWGPYFHKLYKIASVGYFLSAYKETQAEVIETLKSIKSFFCSGDCAVTGGTYPVAKLNYTGFEKWTVFQGAVDLCGLGVYDVLPGNGLYVDMAGTYDPANGVIVQQPGGLLSKDAFSLVDGVSYRFSIDVAGNNRAFNTGDLLKVTIFSEDGTVIFLEEEIEILDPATPFETSTFDFVAAVSKSVKVKIEMIPGANTHANVGPIIDNVLFEDVTNSTTLLTDDFDNENETVVPTTYGYYGPCLETPPGAQSADPSPPTPPAEGF